MPRGYNLSNQTSYRLMQGRLGIYDKYNSEKILDTSLKGIENQDIRIKHLGGNIQ